ncbi:hypothetical protein Tco_1421161 [Tanacetum coccineum]
MVDSQPMEEEFQKAATRDNDQQAKIKATPRKLAYADSNKEAPALSLAKGFSDRFSLESSDTSDTYRQTRSTGSKDAYEELNSPYKRPKPAPFSQRITRFKYHRKAKLPRNIKGVPPVLRISSFMHGHGHPKLAKKLNDKIPKTVNEMFKRVRAFIKGEVAAGSAEMVRPFQGDKGVSFLEPSPLIETPEKQNLNKFCDYHGDKGHNTNDCYQLKKQIEEVVASGKLAHLVKDIRRNNQRNGNQGRNGVKIINMIREKGNRKRPFEEGKSGVINKLAFPAIPQSQLTDEPIKLEGIVNRNRVRRILVDGGSSSEIMYEKYFRNLDINVRSRLRRCKAPMIGFSRETYHPLGLISLRVTMGKEGRSKTVLMEFAIIKCYSPYNLIIGMTEMRSLGAVGSTIHSMNKFPTNQRVVTMETSRETLQECKHLERVQGSWKEVQWHQREEQMSRIREQAILRARSNSERRPGSVCDDRSNVDNQLQTVTGRHSTGKHEGIRMEHQLKIYPLAEPVVHKRRPVAPEERLALKERVFHWLGEGLIRKVRHLEWITNAILIKLANGTSKVRMDYSSLNKACSKDMYPFLEEGEELASLMGYPYKCFLRLSKEYSQIRMAEDDEEKTRFHTEEGVYCFTHMPKELKNSDATLQRMMEKVLADQRGRNVEIHMKDMIDPTMSSFGVKEGKFLGHMVTEEGLRADPERIQAIILSPTQEVRTRMETAKEAGWTNEADEAL